MKTFILTDQDTMDSIAAVQSEELDSNTFTKKAKQAIREHFCLESIELFNWVNASTKKSLYVEGVSDGETVGYIIDVDEIVCY